jgi:hypothetical protein
MLPSPQILKALSEMFGASVIRERIFAQDYAKTLPVWRSNFRTAWPHLMPQALTTASRGDGNLTSLIARLDSSRKISTFARRCLPSPAGCC